ncbi:MAG: DUF4258 domain-containing protein [Bacteroidetes bacterium]|nr:DUF4258 domain-containing protein [Bacteroidota bacterium]
MLRSLLVISRFVFLLSFCFLFTQCLQQDNSNSGPIDRKAANLIYTKHARCRMGCRHITETEIREVLEKGEIDYRKSEPDAKPDPKYALEGYTKEGQHLRIIFAPSNRGLVVITCIELGVEWKCDCD